jgi:hypothetical protein
LDNNIKVVDDYEKSKFRLSINIISQKHADGYTIFYSLDLLEPALLRRLNKDFFCRNYNEISLGFFYNRDVSFEVISNWGSNSVDNFIHELRKDNQR